ncbi:MAG: RICIN domain-containing protein, partial [Lachnospiraceae bacterium]|nr:RICIN domain-containing protein [Lachnospiraceae bacterium]
ETEESEEDEDSDEASEQKDQDSDETGEEAGEDQGKEADQDFTAYGEDEGFAIVPVCAGGSSVDADETTGAIRIRKTSRNNNQAWRIRRSGEYFYFESMTDGGKVVEAKGTSPGSEVEAGTEFNGSDSQLFKLEEAGDGTYFIRSGQNENIVWDVYSSSSADDTAIKLHNLHRKSNQRFRFVHLTTIEEMSDWGASRQDCFAADYDVWDGGADTSWYYADREAPVHSIDSSRELAGLSQLVREGTDDFQGRTIRLTRDISLGGLEWRRIGRKDRPFKGSFNGLGHAITGLTITTTDESDGFFGEVSGGVICNFAIKGAVSGEWNTGGVIGNLSRGHAVNIYSEVSVTRATDDNCGGICGRLGSDAYIEHCTQNARLNSGDKAPDRGGIAGYQCGVVRYCVNLQSVDCNWDHVGGIAGTCHGGKIEYCRNEGKISGGDDIQWAGGICGKADLDSVIFGCYNSGTVFSDDDDDVGGILGERVDDSKVMCCINTGRVYGDDRVGGIVGRGVCKYCFNAGYVTGDDDTGAVSGKAGGNLDWCRSLSWTAVQTCGSDSSGKGAEWKSADAVMSGEACYDLNRREAAPDLQGYGGIYGKEVFYQNIGGDPMPAFSGQKVSKSGGSYVNPDKSVRVEYKKGYGTVTGGGTYSSGRVVLKAEPADGCQFDHFEVTSPKTENRTMNQGGHPYPVTEAETYTEDEIVLTEDIDRSYTVRAVFTAYDDVPADLRQKVKIELECTDEAGGWNTSTIPVYLIDTADERHLWEVSRTSLDDKGEKVSHTFDIGAASPVAIEAWPDFGGGVTFRAYGLKARMWINDAGKAIERSNVTIRSLPFTSSGSGQDSLDIAFGNEGNSSVGVYNADGSLDVKGTYTTCSEAWEAAAKIGDQAVIRLDSVWLTSGRLILEKQKKMTLDLNGYPMIRAIRKAAKDGEVITVQEEAVLNVVDSKPGAKTCSAFAGGSIQGGRSTNGGGVLHVKGTLNMTGGAIYNGGTTDVGGGIHCRGGVVSLNGTLISNCWSNMSSSHDNNGGAIAVRDGAKVALTDCTIRACRADDKGGAIHMNSGKSELTLKNTRITGCRALSDDGGAIYQDAGLLRCENVEFDSCTARDKGGAFHKNTDDQVWFLGCTFTGNVAEKDDGGAIYLDNNYLYMRDCTLRGNAAKDRGGAIYLHSSGSIDMSGVMVVKDNDASGTFDNLVMEKGSTFYDAGLDFGSEVHLRSNSGGEVRLANTKYDITEYQMKNYLVSDYEGGLMLKNVEEVDTQLMASALSPGRLAVIIGGILIALGAASMFIVNKRKQKGGRA